MTTAPPADLGRFSESVRGIASSLDAPISAGALATALMSRHPVEYGAPLLTGPLPSEGVERPVAAWLARCAALIVPEAAPEVIDGRVVLLALGRLDDPLGAAFRQSGVERHLEGDR